VGCRHKGWRGASVPHTGPSGRKNKKSRQTRISRSGVSPPRCARVAYAAARELPAQASLTPRDVCSALSIGKASALWKIRKSRNRN
jgi:hypothetical protein